jgi:putative aldouronate transport system substrate-binding protein
MAMPKTIQEFEAALIAFRDKDPGNVGKNRVVPLAVNEDTRWGLADFIHNAMNNLSDRDRWVYNIADRNLMMPGYKEGVRLMNKWYNNRLIYHDFPLMYTADDLYNQMKSGVVGSFCQNWDLPYRQDYKINEELAVNVPGASFVPVDLNLRNKDMMDKVGLQIFIPIYSKNQEGALKYLNWLAKPENYEFLQVGRAGVNHQMEGGIPRIIGRPANDPWFQNSPQNIDYTMPINGVELGSVEGNARVLALSYGNTPADAIVSAYSISLRNARAPAVYQATTTINQYSNDLREKADVILAQSITASPTDFNRVWDNGMKDWRNSGAQEVYNERAKLYKR